MVAKCAIAWVLGSVALLGRGVSVPLLRNATDNSTAVRVSSGGDVSNSTVPLLRNATDNSTAVRVSSGEDVSNSTVVTGTGKDALDYAGPIEADGAIELIPARTNMRCRYTFLSNGYGVKLYRIFMGPRVLPYHDWCKSVVHAINTHCGKEVDNNNVVWKRCDSDAKDMLWQRGFVTTFELHVGEFQRPNCVVNALRESLPGSIIDWLGHRECYETFGFELEY